MKKTFKKAVAVLLAVLMVVFSVPMSALAAAPVVAPQDFGGYAPDLALQFGTFHAGTDYWTSYASKSTSALSVNFCGLSDVVVDFTGAGKVDPVTGAVSGKLYIDKDKANKANEILMFDDLDEDLYLGVGDYFTVTVMMKNVTELKMLMAAISYSDNIEPAGVYKTSGRGATYSIGSVSDAATAKGTFEAGLGGTSFITGQSIREIYNDGTVNAIDDSADAASINTTDRYINLSFGNGSQVNAGTPISDLSDYYCDPTNGDLNGYTFDDCVIVDTFAFKIVGEGDITFGLYDTNNTKLSNYEGASYIAKTEEAAMVENYTTYALNTYGNADGSENPGSAKMTFMGKNINVAGEEECDHTYVGEVTTAATCTEDGVMTYTCSQCDDSYTEVITATGHTEVEIPAVDATCTTAGSTAGVKCSVCNTVLTQPTEIPALGHAWDDGVVVTAPDCTNGGVTKYTCNTCGATENRDTDATGHTVVDVAAVAPTCTTAGTTAGTKCSVCGTILSGVTEVPATGHDYDDGVITTAPTCTEAGVKTFTCANCDDSYTEVVAATGHTEVEIPAVAATCTTAGATAGVKCSVCDTVLTEPTEIPALDHNYTSEVTTAPTCTEDGVETFTCTRCGDSFTKAIDATGHTEVEIPAVAATCEVAGSTAGVKCSVCNEVLVAPETIDALGHDFSVVVSSTAADCQTVGTTTYQCSRCDETNTVEGGYGPHNEDVVIPAVAATCTTAGATAGTKCSVCGEVQTAPVEIPATGHDYDDGVVTTPATCTEDGVKTFTCANCGDTQTEAVPATGHDYDDGVVTTAPTCTVAGVKTFTCANCGDTKTEEVAATGHTEVEIPAVAATCTTAGATAGTKCSVCDEVLVAPETIDALGHIENTTVTTVDATVDAAGSVTTVVTCDRCGEKLSETVEVLPMLKSYVVTVDATDLGYVTLNGADVSNGGSAKVTPDTKVTLTAKAVDGAQFLGWTANGTTLVSTDTQFTTTVLANVTYTPVFEVAGEDVFTVTFVDMFGNVVSVQTSDNGITVPVAPTRPGYVAATENGWSMTDEEIAALTASATIVAQYVKAEEALYTVTADGCDITINGEAVEGPVEVPYDTKVTVTNTSATAWIVKDAKTGEDVTVGYGDSYTFFVTADITLTYATDAVVATPSVANVGVSSTGVAPRIQAVFKATRTMADGCQYIDSGFVYGKGDLGAITLDDVDGSAVKAAYNKTASEQFSLGYGLSAQQGTITAVAFLAYVDANGVDQVVYAAPMTFTY